MEYTLYLESGPRMQTTMVHVLDLMGCICRGATTEDAISATDGSIREFLGFLHSHGDSVNPDAPFSMRVAAHVMAGSRLGYGDPDPGFAPDFLPLEPGDLLTYQTRLTWMQTALLDMARTLSAQELAEIPANGDRSVRHILEHAADSHVVYLRYLTGPVSGMADAFKVVKNQPADLFPALEHLWSLTDARLAVLSAEEREKTVPHGQRNWTARRCLRRMLEHHWEHVLEVSTRLGKPLS